jgi:hypothetical protein
MKKMEKKSKKVSLWIYPGIKSEFLEPKSFKETFLVQLRPRINSLEKNCFFDLSGVPNTGSSGILLFYEKLITLNLVLVLQLL